MTQVKLNGELLLIEQQLTIQELLHRVAKGRYDGIAVAMNGEVIPRSQWHIKKIVDQDQIDILEAFQGG